MPSEYDYTTVFCFFQGLEFCFVYFLILFFHAKSFFSYLLPQLLIQKKTQQNTINDLRPNKLFLQGNKWFDVHCFLTDVI